MRLFRPQGQVSDIIYKGTKDQIQRAVMPDGKVPLVSAAVFLPLVCSACTGSAGEPTLNI